MTGPLYLHSEGYEPEKEVQVNTILGVVFQPEENTEAKLEN